MGQRFHAKAVIGVRAAELITMSQVRVRVPIEGYYDKGGEPITSEQWFRYFTFQGKNYAHDQCSPDHGRYADPPVEVLSDQGDEDGPYQNDLYKAIKALGLAWVSYDYLNVYDSDVIGVVAHALHASPWEPRDANPGVPQADLASLFADAAQKLRGLGCRTAPNLFSGLHHSY